MTNIELQIKNIVYEEFSKLIQTIEGDITFYLVNLTKLLLLIWYL